MIRRTAAMALKAAIAMPISAKFRSVSTCERQLGLSRSNERAVPGHGSAQKSLPRAPSTLFLQPGRDVFADSQLRSKAEQEFFLFRIQSVILEDPVQREAIEHPRDVIVNRLNLDVRQLEDCS
jgi:hypothetical protein